MNTLLRFAAAGLGAAASMLLLRGRRLSGDEEVAAERRHLQEGPPSNISTLVPSARKHISDLPTELVIKKIFPHLDMMELMSCWETSNNWASLIDAHSDKLFGPIHRLIYSYNGIVSVTHHHLPSHTVPRPTFYLQGVEDDTEKSRGEDLAAWLSRMSPRLEELTIQGYTPSGSSAYPVKYTGLTARCGGQLHCPGRTSLRHVDLYIAPENLESTVDGVEELLSGEKGLQSLVLNFGFALELTQSQIDLIRRIIITAACQEQLRILTIHCSSFAVLLGLGEKVFKNLSLLRIFQEAQRVDYDEVEQLWGEVGGPNAFSFTKSSRYVPCHGDVTEMRFENQKKKMTSNEDKNLTFPYYFA